MGHLSRLADVMGAQTNPDDFDRYPAAGKEHP
jgi:hypothetical protein